MKTVGHSLGRCKEYSVCIWSSGCATWSTISKRCVLRDELVTRDSESLASTSSIHLVRHSDSLPVTNWGSSLIDYQFRLWYLNCCSTDCLSDSICQAQASNLPVIKQLPKHQTRVSHPLELADEYPPSHASVCALSLLYKFPSRLIRTNELSLFGYQLQ